MTYDQFPEKYIESVIYSFVPMIKAKELSVFISRKTGFTMDIETDWEKYQFILFNIIQNAIKYNQFMGSIVIVLDCNKLKNSIDDNEYVLETEIIDTGLGITKQRQEMMFVPFLELKVK